MGPVTGIEIHNTLQIYKHTHSVLVTVIAAIAHLFSLMMSSLHHNPK